ncbi:UDP-N-acetylglucosamine 2-epimerase [Glaciihabitans arcticus]|uniref:UDP-N-acetylglucosamine 2-epimerase n=1 Tax=Glaciihabitans arcticus TaxID=2668039 RepID=UPI001386D049|nr:UDP-N-acetylglucosamine 2-epimerase [Glaciihabitans arcticus]
MTTARRICVLTGTRADYGLLRGLVRAIEASPLAELQLLVTGTHLSGEHGATTAEIAADGIAPASSVRIWSGDDSALGAAVDTGGAITAFSRALDELAPDVLVILGDRLEALAAATAATILGIPVAHIHGGEITEGAMDDALRHAITKLAFLHFTSTEDHRRRVIQLGESPERVFFFGAPVVDALAELDLLGRAALEERFGIDLSGPTVLMTFHPAGMDVLPADELFDELLAALEATDLHLIFTGTNSDIGSAGIRAAMAAFVAAHPDRVDFVESFGQLGYLSTMALVDVVTGNSSSTVLEAPVLGIPSVLVGDRQAGRPIGASVLVPAPDREAIRVTIERAASAEFRAESTGSPSPFGEPGFARRTLAELLAHDIPRPPRKKFHDLKDSQ